MDHLFNIENKVVLITGATGYLGRIFTLELAKRNCTIILHGRDLKKLQALTHEIVSLVDKPNYYVLTFDIKDEDKINSKIKSLNINKIANATAWKPSISIWDGINMLLQEEKFKNPNTFENFTSTIRSLYN